MITTLPLSTAEIVNAVLPRNAAAKGTVERKSAGDVYVIALASGKIALKVPGGDLSEGDTVALLSRGNDILVEKVPPQASGAPPPAQDSVNLQTAPDSATLKLLADTAAQQLKKQVIDKDTLDQLQRILAAVAKNPQRFGADTANAVADLKKIVAAMPSGGDYVDKTAQDLAGRIIDLGEKFAEKLKSDAGAVDVILRAGTKAGEGYYSFDNVKGAISWLSENKEIQENVPWQKLTALFGNGRVVIKVYESAIGDMRASFVAPRQTGDELSHFIASSLRADVWKNVSENVLTSVLYDRKEIPLQRLLEIDASLREAEEQPQEPVSAAAETSPQLTGMQSPPAQSKGFEAAFIQWLTISLDSNAPLQQLVSRVPVESSQQIPSLLSSLPGQQAAISGPVNTHDFSIQQDTLASAPSPEAVLPDLFKRLGLNVESALSSGDESAAEIHPQNLKTVLLTLLGTIENATARAPNASAPPVAQQDSAPSATPTKAPEQDATTQPAAQTPSPDAAAMPASSTQDASRNVRLLVSSVSLNLTGIFDEAAAIVRSLQGLAQSVTGNAVVPQNDSDASRQLIDKADVAKDLTLRIEAFVQSMPKTASDDVERLVRAFQQAQSVLSAGPTPPGSGSAQDAFVRAVLKEVSVQLSDHVSNAAAALDQGRSAIIQGLEKFIAALSGKVNAAPGTGSFVPATPTDQTEKQLAALLADVKQDIVAFVKDLPGSVAAMLRQSSEGLLEARKDLSDLLLATGASPETAEPVPAQVALNLGIAVRMLDILGSRAAVNGAVPTTAAPASTAPAIAAAKQELEEILSVIARTFGASRGTVPARAGTGSSSVNIAAAQLGTLTQTMNESQAGLIRQGLADLDKIIGELSERIEQQTSAGSASRSPSALTQAVTRELATFAATVSDRITTLVREAGAQMASFAAQSADVLETAASWQGPAVPTTAEKPDDISRSGQSQTATAVSGQLERAAQGVQSALSRLETAGLPAGKEAERARQIVRQLQASIGAASRTADASTPTPNPAAAAGRQIMARVDEVADALTKLGRQIQQLVDALPRNEQPRDAAQPSSRRPDLVQNSLKDALRQLDSLARSVAEVASSASHDISRRLDDLASEVSKRLDSTANDAAREQQRSPLDALKQQVENALTRVESLQVLARQVSVTDGQQQVISLPMKIEGQWTDVVVKFLKKKDRGDKKDAHNKPVSVAIHVSPASLGQIDVFMDYGGNKRFAMRMEFEKSGTRAWFEKNKTDFSAALSQIGFTAFRIDMKESGRSVRRQGSPAAPRAGGRGVIDITA